MTHVTYRKATAVLTVALSVSTTEVIRLRHHVSVTPFRLEIKYEVARGTRSLGWTATTVYVHGDGVGPRPVSSRNRSSRMFRTDELDELPEWIHELISEYEPEIDPTESFPTHSHQNE